MNKEWSWMLILCTCLWYKRNKTQQFLEVTRTSNSGHTTPALIILLQQRAPVCYSSNRCL